MTGLQDFPLRMKMVLQFRLTYAEEVTLRHWNGYSPQREGEWISLVTQMVAREQGCHCQDSMSLFTLFPENIWEPSVKMKTVHIP